MIAYYFRHIAALCFDPFILGLVVFFILIVGLVKRKHLQLVQYGLIGLFVGVLVLSTPTLSSYLFRQMAYQYPVVETINPRIHWIVVLGGGALNQPGAPENQLLSQASLERLVEGVRLFHYLPQSTLLLSGNAVEASHFLKVASLFSVPKSAMVLDSNSINTYDQAVNVKQWVHDAPFYLVTSSLHMPRAMALFQKQGLHPIAAPTEYPYANDRWIDKYPKASNIALFQIAWHEILGQGWARLRHQV